MTLANYGPTAKSLPKTHLPMVDHGLKALVLQREQALRALSAMATTAQVLPGNLDEETLDELWQMQAAIGARFVEMQRGWADGWFELLSYSRQIDRANTMSKLAEREYNLAAQAVQLVGDQCEDWLGLMETIQVGYLYWINRKAQDMDAGA